MKIFGVRMRPWVSIAVALTTAAVLAIGVVAVGAINFTASDYQTGQVTASGTVAKSNATAATVGGETITEGDLREAVLHLRHMKMLADRELQGMGENTGLPTAYLQARHDLAIKWGDENVALASLIQDRVLHQKATELGYEASDEELDEAREHARNAYKNGGLDPYTRGYIEAVGEDHYWENIYPILAARSISIRKLHNGVAEEKGAQVYSEARAHWHDFEEGATHAADITMPEDAGHSVTIDSIFGFLSDVRELDRAHLEGDNNPTAPDDKWVVHVKRADGEAMDIVHHEHEPELCTTEGEGGSESHQICDVTGTVLVSDLEEGDVFIITAPGDTLPIFADDGAQE